MYVVYIILMYYVYYVAPGGTIGETIFESSDEKEVFCHIIYINGIYRQLGHTDTTEFGFF